MIKSRIKNCSKTGHEANEEGAGEDQKPKGKRQKESELFHGFWFLKNISVFVICCKIISDDITELTYRDMVIRMVCASEECRHVNPVNLKTLEFCQSTCNKFQKVLKVYHLDLVRKITSV